MFVLLCAVLSSLSCARRVKCRDPLWKSWSSFFLVTAFALLSTAAAAAVQEPEVGYTREQLQPLTKFRQQHRRTTDGRLCAAAFVQNRKAYTDCTDAPNPAGESGRPWCYVESQLLDGGAAWNYCAPGPLPAFACCGLVSVFSRSHSCKLRRSPSARQRFVRRPGWRGSRLRLKASEGATRGREGVGHVRNCASSFAVSACNFFHSESGFRSAARICLERALPSEISVGKTSRLQAAAFPGYLGVGRFVLALRCGRARSNTFFARRWVCWFFCFSGTLGRAQGCVRCRLARRGFRL